MKPEVRKLLLDIGMAISEIEEFISVVDGPAAYTRNRREQLIAERLLGIIGEAVVRVRRLDASVQITAAGKIIAFRNRVVHDYENLDQLAIFNIVQRHIPLLKQEVRALLSSEP